MGMVAILVMWPGPVEPTFVPPHPTETPHEIWPSLAQWFLRWYLKSVDNRRTTDMNRWWTTVASLSHKLTNEPSAQVS